MVYVVRAHACITCENRQHLDMADEYDLDGTKYYFIFAIVISYIRSLLYCDV